MYFDNYYIGLLLTYWTFVGLLSRMNSHVYQQLVTGIEWARSSWTALPEAREVLAFPQFNVTFLNMVD
jgi:hypothetical protein